jgi:hypothetical protein
VKGRRRRGAARGRSRPPRRPEPPVGGAGPAVDENAYFPYFLFSLDVAPPPSSSSSPASRATSLHHRAPLRPSPMRARRLPSLAPLAVGSHPVLVAAAPLPARSRRVRVRVRARVRADRDALAQRAPQHARTVTLETRLVLWPFSCARPPARTLVACAAMASPWRVPSRTRTQRRERCPLDRRERVSPPTAIPTRVRAQLRPSNPPPPMAPA